MENNFTKITEIRKELYKFYQIESKGDLVQEENKKMGEIYAKTQQVLSHRESTKHQNANDFIKKLAEAKREALAGWILDKDKYWQRPSLEQLNEDKIQKSMQEEQDKFFVSFDSESIVSEKPQIKKCGQF